MSMVYLTASPTARRISRREWRFRRLRTDRKAKKDAITTAILALVVVSMYAWLLVRLCTDPMVSSAEARDTFLSEDVVEAIEKVAPKYNISVEIVEALVEAESSGNPYALSKSGRGYGLTQIHYYEHKDIMDELDIDSPEMLYDPVMNINAACMYLDQLREQEGDIFVALGRYNGRKTAINPYVKRIINRAYELEEVHGKHEY